MVVVVEGDVTAGPDLGLSTAALAEVTEHVTVVIHCAARIGLNDPIQASLRTNYCGTDALLTFAERRLALPCAAFLHVSSAFVSMGQPHGSTVPEEWRPLLLGDREVDHARLASELLSAPPAAADLRAALLCRWWRLPGTYLLSKNLSEALVASHHANGALPIAIVRPSLMAAVAGEPYPGYVGNLAGPSGILTAYAMGFFGNNSIAWRPTSIMDNVPGDVAAGVVLAAAAALAAGVRSREQLYGEAPLDKVPSSSPPSPSSSVGSTVTPAASEEVLSATLALAADTTSKVAHASTTHPLAAVSDEGRASAGGRNDHVAGDRQSQDKGTVRRPSPAASAAANGSAERPRDAPGTLLVFHAATGTINPCMMGWMYEMAQPFYLAHGPKFRLTRSYQIGFDANYVPEAQMVARQKRMTGFKVAAATALLSCFGQNKAAHKLRTGYAAWDYANDPSHDVTHFFSVRNVEALEAALPQQERAELPVLWRGDWHPYFNTYMAAVHRLFLGLPVPPSTAALPHAFVHRPHVHMAEEDLPRVAGRAEAAGGGGGGRRAGKAVAG